MHHRPAPLLLLLALGAAGCPADPGPADDPPPDSVTFWQGTVVATKPDGSPLGPEGSCLVRRGLAPADALIDERRVERAEGDDVAVDLIYAITVVPEDSTFRIQTQDADGLLEGFGALSAGETWAWTRWESTLEYTSGDLVGASRRIEAEVSGNSLSITEELRGIDGDLEVVSERDLSAISAEDFTGALEALLGS